jgi:hypothetical protein
MIEKLKVIPDKYRPRVRSEFEENTVGAIQRLTMKMNEIIDVLITPEEPRVLICPHCYSDKWAKMSSTTLMGGPINYHTYHCFECGKSTKVMRVSHTETYQYINLGPKDEIVK